MIKVRISKTVTGEVWEIDSIRHKDLDLVPSNVNRMKYAINLIWNYFGINDFDKIEVFEQ